MSFLSLLVAASMPVLQLLLIGSLGAFLAYKFTTVFSDSFRRNMNKIVFAVFSPSLVFASLARTVTLEELISWWYMPVNIGITFLIGGILGWISVKILRPARHLEGLIIANCSAGNLGNLMLMIVPAVCGQPGNPFGDQSTCRTRGLSYVSSSMALGGFYIWTHTYSLIKRDGSIYEESIRDGSVKKLAKQYSSAGVEDQTAVISEIREASNDPESQLSSSVKSDDLYPNEAINQPLLSSEKMKGGERIWKMVIGTFHELAEELVEPPTVAAVTGFVVGAIPWLKSLIIGTTAPLRVIQDSLELLGSGTLPCTTLILGGNLTRGMGKSAVKASAIVAIALVRYAALPTTGIFVVKAASSLGFLPEDPLFSYVLLTQFTLPPAVAIARIKSRIRRMGFLSLLIVASTPVLQNLLIGGLGAYFASGYSSIFSDNARRDMNRIVFTLFTPSLVFISLVKTVTLEELVSWWFMPFNITLTFLIGGTLGWTVVKVLRPPSHLEGLIVANCSAGNLGNLLLVIIPALCTEDGSPFASQGTCGAHGISYVSLSMALCNLFIWTHSYNLMKRDCITYEKLKKERLMITNTDDSLGTNKFEDRSGSSVESGEDSKDEDAQRPPARKSTRESPQQIIKEPLLSGGEMEKGAPLPNKIMAIVHLMAKQLMEPPAIAALSGFVVGSVPWLKSLIIGGNAPLRVIKDSLEILGDGTLPCTILILGGNLIGGLKKSAVKTSIILAIVTVRYVALPLSGIIVVKGAHALGFLPQDPLFSFVLLMQFSLPSAASIGVMAQLFGVGQEESSVIFLWIYLVAALALTAWSTVFMYILS